MIAVVDYGVGAARGQGFLRELVAVERIALQGEEDRAGRAMAAIGRYLGVMDE